jgi:hypothetical protein
VCIDGLKKGAIRQAHMKPTGILAGGLCGAVAVLLAVMAVRLFARCTPPVWKTTPPTTVHLTVIICGVQFSGNQLIIPPLVLAVLAGALLWFAISWMNNGD